MEYQTFVHQRLILPVGRVKFNLLFGHALHLLAEAFEGGLEFVSELPLALLSGEVISVVHVLVLAQIRCDFSHLRVELDVHMLFLT